MDHEDTAHAAGPSAVVQPASLMIPETPGDSKTDLSRLEINLDILNGMTESAIIQYRDCIAKFALSLARETSRLEEADRAEEAGNAEITTTMVIKANAFVRQPPSRDPFTRMPIAIAQTIAIPTTIIAPIFGANLHSKWQWTATIASGIIAVISQAYVIFAARRK